MNKTAHKIYIIKYKAAYNKGFNITTFVWFMTVSYVSFGNLNFHHRSIPVTVFDLTATKVVTDKT